MYRMLKKNDANKEYINTNYKILLQQILFYYLAEKKIKCKYKHITKQSFEEFNLKRLKSQSSNLVDTPMLLYFLCLSLVSLSIKGYSLFFNDLDV